MYGTAERIESSVLGAIEASGFELLKEGCDRVNGSGESNRTYRVVESGGMVPFAEVRTHAGHLSVTVSVAPLPHSNRHEDYAYYLPDPGAIPKDGCGIYPEIYSEWASSPERLAELAANEVGRAFAGRKLPETATGTEN